MTTGKVVARFVKTVSGAIERVARDLAAIDIRPGVELTWPTYRGMKTFTITSVKADLYSGKTPYIALYGRLHRKDGTVGKHIHYIGSLR